MKAPEQSPILLMPVRTIAISRLFNDSKSRIDKFGISVKLNDSGKLATRTSYLDFAEGAVIQLAGQFARVSDD